MKESEVNIEFAKFPTTRYQGSKRKILPWIYSTIKDIEFETALDGFGGSASVSYLLKRMGKSITYNDNLRFNYLIGKALIENQNVVLTKEDIAGLESFNEGVTYSNFIENTFPGIYYTKAENKWLDKVTNNIVQMNHYPENVLEYKKALSFYALFQSSMIKRPFNLFHRKNLYIRTSNVKRNFGNKTTWEKSFSKYLKRFTSEANDLVFSSEKECKAINASIFDIDPYGYDFVYLDPPYFRKDGTNESSNYLKCYHFLEGLSRYADWDGLIDYDTINHRFKNGILPNGINEENPIKMFEEILSKFSNSKIVFSYKVGGIPSIETLIKIMKKIKKNVRQVTKHYKYALNHQNGDAEKNREVLIIGT